jgi:hypothetical protein
MVLIFVPECAANPVGMRLSDKYHITSISHGRLTELFYPLLTRVHHFAAELPSFNWDKMNAKKFSTVLNAIVSH